MTSRPEVIFFDAENMEFKFDVYSDFVSSRVFYIPKIVVLSLDPENMIFNDDNIIVLDKKNYSDHIVKLLSQLDESEAKTFDGEKLEECRSKVTKLLSDLGVTTKYLGYEYIKELVVNIICDRRMLKSFNTKLYPKIAIKYNTQVNNVERNIRNAIGVAISRCKNKNLFDDICGKASLSYFNKVPSNKQFITWLVDKVS
jgi:hypothetical protein